LRALEKKHNEVVLYLFSLKGVRAFIRNMDKKDQEKIFSFVNGITSSFYSSMTNTLFFQRNDQQLVIDVKRKITGIGLRLLCEEHNLSEESLINILHK
jgi:hypothetical protein